MAGVLERLELEQPTIITSDILTQILGEEGVRTPTRIVAARLRKNGWLLPTSKNGVWEFIPASSAGPYSKNDPLLNIKALMAKHPNLKIGLTFQTAAWLHRVADRIPMRLEAAIDNPKISRLLDNNIVSSVFSPNLQYDIINGVFVLKPESIIVHMTTKPRAVRSWSSAIEWLPDLAALLDITSMQEELNNRSKAIKARTGYLLQRLRPDIAEVIYENSKPSTKSWFGTRATLLRHDNKWLIADTILPFNPKELEKVT